MNDDEIVDRLVPIFQAALKIEPSDVTRELSPKTCAKWDSLSHIHLVNGIEEEFGISLEFADQMRMTSFGVAVEIVGGRLRG